jgi:hypothetical protein
MTKLEKLENEVKLLAADELAAFREWFLEYDWAKWDQEIKADAAAGRLDGMVKEAMKEFKAGKSKKL